MSCQPNIPGCTLKCDLAEHNPPQRAGRGCVWERVWECVCVKSVMGHSKHTKRYERDSNIVANTPITWKLWRALKSYDIQWTKVVIASSCAHTHINFPRTHLICHSESELFRKISKPVQTCMSIYVNMVEHNIQILKCLNARSVLNGNVSAKFITHDHLQITSSNYQLRTDTHNAKSTNK